MANVAQFIDISDGTGDLSGWAATTQSSGTCAAATDQLNTGVGYSIKCVSTSSSSTCRVNSTSTLMADAGRRFSFWVRFSTVTPSVPAAILQITGSGTSMMVLGLNTNGTLRADGRNATGVNGSTTLSANTWYRVTFSYKIISTGNWGITIWLNGNSEIVTSNTQGSINQTGSDTLFLGIQISFDLFGATPNMTMWFDSLYMDNGTDLADPGTISVTAKRPFANGTTNGYTTQIGSGGSGYGSGHAPQVNERPASQTNGWSMIGAGSAVTEEYNIEGVSVGDVDLTAATIVDYTGWLISKSLAGETRSSSSTMSPQISVSRPR